jgi:hypothetical protein
MVSSQMVDAAYKAGDQQLAAKINAKVRKDLTEQLGYYAFLGDMSVPELRQAVQELMEGKGDNLNNRQKSMFQEIRMAFGLQEYLDNIERTYKNPTPAAELPGVIQNK